MKQTAENKLLASVFELVGRAVSQDLTAATAEEADRGYVARLRTLSRLLKSGTSYITAAHEDGDANNAVGLVTEALEAMSVASDAGFWLAIENATDDELIRIAFAFASWPRHHSDSTLSVKDIALGILANSPVSETVPS